ncbi:MAG TPA: hypothetical protein VFD39_03905, partial [Trueperaceae bacterium]|nr:hypothetical protein [Trueperaceae bacterium]
MSGTRGNASGPIRVANAPCSWGTIEGFGEKTPWHTMLDELAATDYAGTELGDYGFMPTDPQRLSEELNARGLVMLGGFEGVPLRQPGVVKSRRERLLTVARLLASVGDEANSRATVSKRSRL